jgi:hypothetical protein
MVVVHVEPVNDVVRHECDGGALSDCVCGPAVTFLDDAVNVPPHSFDGREESE